MKKINIGLIGYGNVGAGVVKFLQQKRPYIKEKFQTDFVFQAICDRDIKTRKLPNLKNVVFTTEIDQVVKAPGIDVVVELIGGVHPAREIAMGALENGKHFVTANKALISTHGKELFETAHRCGKNVYFESSVMAGVPIIKTITEGLAGNRFTGLYGIINGTCNYILSEMCRKDLTFAEALKEAQNQGFAESNPTLDINGMDSAHKLAVLISLGLGKFISLSDIHVEGITHISHHDIEYAESLDLTIKLLAIAKRVDNTIEARVHPTLFSKEHPLASINGIVNAVHLHCDPLGDVLLSGEGAGQMAAASGVVSDLINLAARCGCASEQMLGNLYGEEADIRIRTIDEISTKFYLRFMALDKPGVLAQITGVLGEHGISINSVTQKAHENASAVPVIMLTDYAQEKMLRLALDKIHQMPIVKSRPVAIRLENLK